MVGIGRGQLFVSEVVAEARTQSPVGASAAAGTAETCASGTSGASGAGGEAGEGRRPARDPRPVPARRRHRLLTAAALLLVTAPMLAYAGYLLVARPALYDHGDQVLLELGVLRATHFDQLVGAYSQFGFAHPGPTWFYLMSPFYRLLGADLPAAVAGAAVIEAGFAAAVVALAARWRGGRAALVTAVTVLLYVRAIAVPAVTYLWNPFAVMPATILFVLLAAGAATGARRARWGAAIIGSFLIQTDISTAPLVGCVALWLLVAVRPPGSLGALWARRSQWSKSALRSLRFSRIPRPHRPEGFACAALVVLVGEWIPPVLQQITQSPGNFTQLASTLLGGGGNLHSPWAALAAETQAVSVFPLGSLAWDATASSHPGVGGLAVLLLWVCAAAALRRSGLRRGDWLAAALGTLSLWTVGISFVAACIVRGGMNTYQFYWMTGLPLVTLFGWIFHAPVVRLRPRVAVRRVAVSRARLALMRLELARIAHARSAALACTAAALLLAAAVAENLIDFTSRSAPHYKSADTPLTTADRLVDGYLAGHMQPFGGRGVLLLDRGDAQGKEVTVVLELVRNLYQRGWRPILPAQLAAHDQLPNPRDPVRCTVVIAADRTGIPAGYTVLGALGPGPNAPVAAVLGS